MTQHHLKRPDQAKAWLNKAILQIEKDAKLPSAPFLVPKAKKADQPIEKNVKDQLPPWQERLRGRLLRQEAEALIRLKQP
jgi:hypothetical protein